MLEAALTFLPLFALIFGICDVSMLVFLKGVFQHASREGARWAITYSTTYRSTACTYQEDCIKMVVRDNSMGFLQATPNYITVRYFAPWDLTTPLTTVPVDPPAGSTQWSRVNYVNQPGNVIEVAIENRPWSWMIPLRGIGLNATTFMLSAASSDVMQGLPIGVTVPPSARSSGS